MDLLNTEVVAGLTALHLIIAVGVLLLIGIGLQSLQKEKTDGARLLSKVQCGACGWKGTLSQHQNKCPQCNGGISHGA